METGCPAAARQGIVAATTPPRTTVHRQAGLIMRKASLPGTRLDGDVRFSGQFPAAACGTGRAAACRRTQTLFHPKSPRDPDSLRTPWFQVFRGLVRPCARALPRKQCLYRRLNFIVCNNLQECARSHGSSGMGGARNYYTFGTPDCAAACRNDSNQARCCVISPFVPRRRNATVAVTTVTSRRMARLMTVYRSSSALHGTSTMFDRKAVKARPTPAIG